MVDDWILLHNIRINNTCIYMLIVFASALFCRAILCFFKMIAIKQGEANSSENGEFHDIKNELSFGDAYLYSFLSISGYATIDDYWLPFIIGIIELSVFPILMATNHFNFLGFWLGAKTASQWGSWQKSRTAYNRFLLGNIVILFVAFLFLTPFIELIKGK